MVFYIKDDSNLICYAVLFSNPYIFRNFFILKDALSVRIFPKFQIFFKAINKSQHLSYLRFDLSSMIHVLYPLDYR